MLPPYLDPARPYPVTTLPKAGDGAIMAVLHEWEHMPLGSNWARVLYQGQVYHLCYGVGKPHAVKGLQQL